MCAAELTWLPPRYSMGKDLSWLSYSDEGTVWKWHFPLKLGEPVTAGIIALEEILGVRRTVNTFAVAIA